MQNIAAFPLSHTFPALFPGIFLTGQKAVKTLSASGTRPREGGFLPPHTRVAILDADGSFRIQDIGGDSFPDYAVNLTGVISQELGGSDPAASPVALKEIVDNLIHALPCSVSVVLDPHRKNLFLSDTGPGIHRLDLAFEPGYSTATELHRSFIRGVGMGLFLAQEEIRSLGGELRIDSDPGNGTYVQASLMPTLSTHASSGADAFPLTQRQNNVLFLLSEGESLGPSLVAAELNIGVSTAHRDLVKLQELGLIYVDSSGKRFLSELGRSYLQSLLSL